MKRTSLPLRRRDVITLVGGVAAWPITARAQQLTMPVVGLLSGGASGPDGDFAVALRQGLNDVGFFEGQNVSIEYRLAGSQFDRLPALASDLVRRQVTVIAVSGGIISARAAKSATTTIPIVFAIGSDPVEDGLVASLSRPGGNITGVTFFTSTLEPKRLELLRELVPQAATIAVLVNPNSPRAELERRAVEAAARSVGQEIALMSVGAERDLEKVFATLGELRAKALFVMAGAFFFNQRDQLVALAARHRMPTIYQSREFAAAGGLMSYGASFPQVWRQVGVYVGRILKGEKPADLPVVQPTRFELIINLRTAKELGLEIPPTLLARADEVIE